MRYKCQYCHRPAVAGGRCARHPRGAREVRAQRTGTPGRSGARRRPRTFRYGREWALRAAKWLAENPWCARCARKPAWLGERQFTPAVHVDHIVPVKVAPGRAFDDTNFQSLCLSCHSAKSGRERIGEFLDFARGIVYVLDSDGHVRDRK